VITNGGATNMTDMLLPGGTQTNADVIIQASNGNTTIINGATIVTTSGANVLMVANRPYRFIKNSDLSGAWYQLGT
jgi:fructose/tagatose bisphosphate aldolase